MRDPLFLAAMEMLRQAALVEDDVRRPEFYRAVSELNSAVCERSRQVRDEQLGAAPVRIEFLAKPTAFTGVQQ